MNKRHVILGVTFWLVAAATTWLVLRAELTAQSSSVASLTGQVGQWISGQNSSLRAVSEVSLQVKIGDPIFVISDDGLFRQVGLLTDIDGSVSKDPRSAKDFEVVIYDDATNALDGNYRLEYHTTPMSLDWVVRTMIPRERQKEIAQFIATEWQQHQVVIMTEMRPVIKDGIRTAMKAVEAELPTILKEHRDEFQSLADRYETEIIKAEVLPLVKSEILPIVEEEALPVVEEVGRALWKRVSLWSFAWRFLYDKSPLPTKDAVKEEFQRFVDEVALPELRSRSDQFMDVTETIVKRSMDNPKIKAAMKRNFKRVAEDPELHKVVWSVVREAVVENETLRAELELHLKAQETKSAMKLAGERLEPMVRDIGDMIFGSRDTGITPEFSRILRSQILQKDRRWFVIVPTDVDSKSPGQLTVVVAREPMVYPMGFGGAEQSPLTPVEQ